MPLAWAHAEYLKLDRSLRDGKIFDLPPQTVKRYLHDKTVSSFRAWRFNHKIRDMQFGKTLRIETLAPVAVHWSSNGWQTALDAVAADTGLGVYAVDLDTANLAAGTQIQFTFYWQDTNQWENVNFSVSVTV